MIQDNTGGEMILRIRFMCVVWDITLNLLHLFSDRDDHLALKMDVTDKTSVESAISSAIDKYKAPPCLVTNAAGIIRDGFMLQMDEKSFMEVLDVNLKVWICFSYCFVVVGVVLLLESIIAPYF